MLDLGTRTENFALAIINLYSVLPQKNVVLQVVGKQLLRSGTSVGAHYHEGKRARSTAEFCSKIEGGLQELEETCYWLRLLNRTSLQINYDVEALQREANELLAIFVTCSKNAKQHYKSVTS